jgi:prepilin signal peptidase PulO-like enzyme (type II secretory pathway)
MLLCPYCSSPAMSHLTKAFLGPARSVRCRCCDKRVSVSWWSIPLYFAMAVPMLIIWFATRNPLLLVVMLVVGTVANLLFQAFVIPVSPRDGPVPTRCSGCGRDFAGLAPMAKCSACGKVL